MRPGSEKDCLPSALCGRYRNGERVRNGLVARQLLSRNIFKTITIVMVNLRHDALVRSTPGLWSIIVHAGVPLRAGAVPPWRNPFRASKSDRYERSGCNMQWFTGNPQYSIQP